VPEKTTRIAGLLGLQGDLLDAASAWCARLGVRMRLSDNGATEAQLAPWAVEAHGIRRLMDNNPRDMSVAEVEAIYRAAF
jgi:alcohol dehydrogenase